MAILAKISSEPPCQGGGGSRGALHTGQMYGPVLSRLPCAPVLYPPVLSRTKWPMYRSPGKAPGFSAYVPSRTFPARTLPYYWAYVQLRTFANCTAPYFLPPLLPRAAPARTLPYYWVYVRLRAFANCTAPYFLPPVLPRTAPARALLHYTANSPRRPDSPVRPRTFLLRRFPAPTTPRALLRSLGISRPWKKPKKHVTTK